MNNKGIFKHYKEVQTRKTYYLTLFLSWKIVSLDLFRAVPNRLVLVLHKNVLFHWVLTKLTCLSLIQYWFMKSHGKVFKRKEKAICQGKLKRRMKSTHLSEKSVWLYHFLFSASSVYCKSYRQILTPVDNLLHLLSLPIFDKTRLVAFCKRLDKETTLTGFYHIEKTRVLMTLIHCTPLWRQLLFSACGKLMMLSFKVWQCWVNQLHYHNIQKLWLWK